MRKTISVLSLILILVFAFGSAEARDKADVDAKIKKVISFLDQPEGPGEDGKLMVSLLIEAILQAAPETGFPPAFIENMNKAKGISDSTSVLNPDGIAYLHNAYRLVNSGSDFEFPGGIKEIQDAVDHIRVELATARDKLKSGQTDACAKILLEAVLMTVTPVIR